MIIRQMTRDDLDGAHRLLCEVFGDPWTREMIEGELARRDAQILIAEDGGEVVAFLAFEKILDQAAIEELAVSRRYRRRGVARRMVEQMIASFDDLCSVTLEVRRSNLPAVSLYTSLGFNEVGVRKNYYSHPTEDALIMTKKPEDAL